MMSIVEATAKKDYGTRLSRIIANNPPLICKEGKVQLDERRLREEIFLPSILSRIFSDVAIKFHQNLLDRYLAYMRDYAAPVIATPISSPDEYKRFMIYRPRTLSTITNLQERLKWEGIRKSFEASGVNCISAEFDENDPATLMWPRDPCIILGNVAFFPDPKLMLSYLGLDRISNHELLNVRLDTWQQKQKFLKKQGLKVVVVDGCYFEGGNLIPDEESGFLFCGVKDGDYKRENINLLCKAISIYTDYNFTPIYVPTCGTHHPHLDMGVSQSLSNGKLLVCKELGVSMNGEGYDILKHHLGENRIYSYSFHTEKEMPANLVNIGSVAMMPSCSPELRMVLKNDGIIVNAPTEEDLRGTRYSLPDRAPSRVIGRGGIHCLTNEALFLK